MGEVIIIGSDKSGFALKEAVKQWLSGRGYEVKDLGTQDVDNFMPYFEVASVVSRAIQAGEAKRGILICGTGVGVSIVANKFKGVYAALASDIFGARLSSVVNVANVLALGGWVTAPEMSFEMIKSWLDTPFGEGFPPDRVDFLKNALEQVEAIEHENFK